MTMLKRSLLILGIGAGALCLTMGGAWLVLKRGSSYFTDGKSIRVPASEAPLRSILWQPATPLPGSINSTADEYEPRVSADGSLMVFVRGKPGSNTDLLQSKWTLDGWTPPVPIASVNTEHDELGPELSRDGKSLYFYSDRPGGLGGYDIWVAHAADDGWSAPVNLGPNANSASNEYGPALAPDGSEVFFASNRPRPGEPTPERESWSATIRETRDRHDYDLYASRLGDSGAEAAQPILALNTPADEGAPAISPVGDFLYFASDRDGGRGGFDIYPRPAHGRRVQPPREHRRRHQLPVQRPRSDAEHGRLPPSLQLQPRPPPHSPRRISGSRDRTGRQARRRLRRVGLALARGVPPERGVASELRGSALVTPAVAPVVVAGAAARPHPAAPVDRPADEGAVPPAEPARAVPARVARPPCADRLAPGALESRQPHLAHHRRRRRRRRAPRHPRIIVR